MLPIRIAILLLSFYFVSAVIVQSPNNRCGMEPSNLQMGKFICRSACFSTSVPDSRTAISSSAMKKRQFLNSRDKMIR